MTAVVFGGSSNMKLNQKGVYMAFRKGWKGPDKEGHNPADDLLLPSGGL